MTQAHEHDRFRNAAVYTVAVTYTVAGSARRSFCSRARSWKAQHALVLVKGATSKILVGWF